ASPLGASRRDCASRPRSLTFGHARGTRDGPQCARRGRGSAQPQVSFMAELVSRPAEFQVGDKAVYPGYGVAEITGIENREISGSQQKFYVLRVLGKDMTLMVPMSNANSVGLRNIIGEAEVEAVYEVLRKRGEKISTA